MTKKALLLILSISLMITSCAKKPTTLRMALWTFPEDFDILTTTSRFSSTVADFNSIITDNIFETLVKPNFLDQPQNVLIDHFYSVKDTLIIVQLKEGIRFSDGTMLTTDDIKESVRRYHFYLSNKTSFDFLDIVPINDNIVHFYLNKENHKKINMAHFSEMPIYKGDYIRNFSDELLCKYPIGTGPYYLYSATDTLIVLKKNRHYRDFARMAQNPDIIEYHHEPDLHNQYQMLTEGKIDFLLEMEFIDYSDAISDPNIKIYSRLSDSYSYLALDSMSPYKKDINLPYNPLQDRRVRQAIAHSINIEQYIENQLLGQAIPLAIPAPVQINSYPTYLSSYTHDLDTAKRLLKEAGVENGFKMSLYATWGFHSIRMAELVQASLANIGIDVDLKYFEGVELHQELAKQPPSAYVVRYSLTNPASQDLAGLLRNHINYTPSPKSQRNYHKLYNPKIHAHLDSLSVENIEETHKAKVHNRAMEAIYDEVMVVPLLQPFIFHALQKDIVWNTKRNNRPLAIEFEMR